jgi:hypothetical protein
MPYWLEKVRTLNANIAEIRSGHCNYTTTNRPYCVEGVGHYRQLTDVSCIVLFQMDAYGWSQHINTDLTALPRNRPKVRVINIAYSYIPLLIIKLYIYSFS